jgi:hypothetical protein
MTTLKVSCSPGAKKRQPPCRARASRLRRETALQGDLFDGEVRERRQVLDRTVDTIRVQFGAAAVRRGSSLDRSDKNEG